MKAQGRLMEKVEYFWYLGRLLTASEYDWLVFQENLHKSKYIREIFSQVLMGWGVAPWTSRKMHKFAVKFGDMGSILV